ncbi:peptidoglycan editing factor [Thermobifida phage P318]|nr:peptidoglycan editing factor [Thermobifida phage P318]
MGREFYLKAGATPDDVLDWVSEEAVRMAIKILEKNGTPVTEKRTITVAQKIVEAFVDDLEREDPEFVQWLTNGATDR